MMRRENARKKLDEEQRSMLRTLQRTVRALHRQLAVHTTRLLAADTVLAHTRTDQKLPPPPPAAPTDAVVDEMDNKSLQLPVCVLRYNAMLICDQHISTMLTMLRAKPQLFTERVPDALNAAVRTSM